MVFIILRYYKRFNSEQLEFLQFKTLEAWLDLLKLHESTISEIFLKEYGSHAVKTQLNNWKLFYIMSR